MCEDEWSEVLRGSRGVCASGTTGVHGGGESLIERIVVLRRQIAEEVEELKIFAVSKSNATECMESRTTKVRDSLEVDCLVQESRRRKVGCLL